MLTILLVILLVVLAFVAFLLITNKFNLNYESRSILFALLILFALIVSFLLGNYLERKIYEKSEKIEVIEEIDKLEALSDSSSSKTYIRTYGSKDSYVFRYLVISNYGKQVKEINNDNKTHIVETNEIEPSIVKYSHPLKNKFLDFLVFDSAYDKERRIEIIVPEGTISEGFQIDLQ